MPTYVALLRAVNVGGTGKLRMEDLREMLNGLGYTRVETYIQSGNAVFNADGTPASVARKVASALEELMGTPVGLVVRTHDELTRVIAKNPFAVEAAANGARVHAGFLAAPAPVIAAASLQKIAAQDPARRERFHLSGDTLYLHFPEGAADTKLSGKPLDRALGVMATVRNWNTVLKLNEMSDRS